MLPGERLPFCFGMAVDRRFYSSEEQAGRAAVMILARQTAPDDLHPVIDNLCRESQAFAASGADLLMLCTGEIARALRDAFPAPSPVRIIDADIGFLVRCGLGSGILALVVDRNLRVALRLESPDAAEVAAACLDCLAKLPHESPTDALLPAPLLMLPNLVSRDFCQELIELFEQGSSIYGEITTLNAAGVPQNRVDERKKCRRDLVIPPEDALHGRLRETLLRRCAPEIARAFQAKVCHTDRILLARYDAPGGWFRRHRDNGAENIAFREFAISVNLNTEDYDGGHLLFPEYNDHRYRPPTGAGIIFSASLLHEATPVSRGRRTSC